MQYVALIERNWLDDPIVLGSATAWLDEPRVAQLLKNPKYLKELFFIPAGSLVLPLLYHSEDIASWREKNNVEV